MAYTNSPSNDTYSTHRITAAHGIALRETNAVIDWSVETGIQSDPGMVNFLYKKEKNGQEETPVAITRPRMVASKVVAGDPTNTVRGYYIWEKAAGLTYYFLVMNNKVYANVNNSVWLNPVTLATGSVAQVGFCEHISDANVKTLVLVDGVDGYVFTSNSAYTKITSPNFPTPHVPYPVFIDGYVFLAKAGTGDIYNCDLNAPLTWTAGNFLGAEVYPDSIQALVKVNNYLLAIGSASCEYFYDAGNFPGSPLARYEGAVLPFGTNYPTTIASNLNTVIFLANSNDGQPVLRIIEDFKYKDVSSSFLVPMLNSRQLFAADKLNIRGMLARVDDDLLYVLNLKANNYQPTESILKTPCLVYSIKNEIWTEFRLGVDTAGTYSTTTYPFPIVCTALSSDLATQIAGMMPSTGEVFTGYLSRVTALIPGDNRDVYNNAGTVALFKVDMEIRTPSMDFGTMNLKFMSRLTPVIDLQYAAGNVENVQNTNVTLSWTDSDWFSVDSYPDSLSYSYSGGSGYSVLNKPMFTRLGSFRRRAIRLRITSNLALTVRGIEMDINKGQQ